MNQLKERQKHCGWLNSCSLRFRAITHYLLHAGKKLGVYLNSGCHEAVRFLRDFPPWKMARGVFYISIFLLFCDIARTAYAWWAALLGYCLPHFVYWLLVGFLLFLFGAFAQMFPKQWLGKGRLKTLLLIFRAILFAVAVAGGGFVTTYGWNERSQYQQERILLISIARDWQLNDARIKYISDYRDSVRASDYKFMTMFPSFTTDNISRAMTFKRFDPSYGNRLATSLFRYVHTAEIIAAHFYIINSTQSSLIPYRDNKGKQVIFEELFKEGALYDAFVHEHKLIGKIMRLNFREIFDKLDNIDTHKEFYFWDPSLPYKMRGYIFLQEAKRKKANESTTKKVDSKP